MMSKKYLIKDEEEIIDLSGLKIVVTANELEPSEHRGISAYTKNLVKTLSNAGAEVWLLTEFYTPYTSKRFNNIKINFINLSYILEFLSKGFTKKPEQLNTVLKNFSLLRYCLNIKNYIFKLFTSFRLKEYPNRKLKFIKNVQYDSPYSRLDRMDYLKYITGFISARKIYYSSLIRIILRIKSPVKIDLKDFDVVITSCPLNIRPINIKHYIQTIHDLIPLEHSPYPYMDSVFLNRLNETINSKRLFISHTTKSKYDLFFDINSNHLDYQKDKSNTIFDKVAIQPPTLRISNQILISKSNDLVFNPQNINQKKQNYVEVLEKKNLYKYQYILFNASVDPRKNLSLILNAYNQSNLYKKNIRLCICGKIPNKQESKSILSVIKSSNGIISTGYVSEQIKSQLYLYALATINTSLIEGFGLPVFDASCLGLKSYVSDCFSHHEIHDLFDFSDFVNIIKLKNFQGWIRSLNSISPIEADFEEIAQYRISRYKLYEKRIEKEFLYSLNSLIKE